MPQLRVQFWVCYERQFDVYLSIVPVVEQALNGFQSLPFGANLKTRAHTFLGLTATIFAVLISACAMNEGSKERGFVGSMTSQRGKSLPAPSQNFQPTDVLPFASMQVHKAALRALDDARVSILSESKEDGRIATDYVAGPSFDTALGLLGNNSTRYKYLLSIKPSGRGTKLKVTAYLESSGSEVQSWRDVSAENQTQVNSVQNALIENIENALTRETGVSPASKQVASPTSASQASTTAPKMEPAPTQMSTLEMQKRLSLLKYQVGIADGLMGARSANALKKFQLDNGLPQTGQLNPETQSKLFEKAGSSLK